MVLDEPSDSPKFIHIRSYRSLMNSLELTLSYQKRSLVFTRGAISEGTRHALDRKVPGLQRDQSQIHATHITQNPFSHQ